MTNSESNSNDEVPTKKGGRRRSPGDPRFDFRHKIGICRKESRETKHWLRMVVAAVEELADDARPLWREAKELNLIFGSIRRKCD